MSNQKRVTKERKCRKWQPLGKKIEWIEDFFPSGCRGEMMMRIMEERLDLTTARLLVPDLEEQTHRILMRMHDGEISCGEREKPAKVKAEYLYPEKQAKIKELTRAGLTYRQIGELIGMSKTGISYALTGK